MLTSQLKFCSMELVHHWKL